MKIVKIIKALNKIAWYEGGTWRDYLHTYIQYGNLDLEWIEGELERVKDEIERHGPEINYMYHGK